MSELLLHLQVEEIQDNLEAIRNHKYKLEDILKNAPASGAESEVQEIQNELDGMRKDEAELIKKVTILILSS